MFKISKTFYFLTAAVIALLAVMLIVQYSVEDTQSPVITIETQSISVSVLDGDDVLLQGVYAQDDVDGDLTNAVVVEDISDFQSDGSRIVTYAVSDSSKNVAKAERTVTYTDYVSPRFDLSGDLTYFSSNTSINLAQKITASDLFDGDITPLIKLTDENIVVGQGGQYTIELSVYNSAGDCSVIELPVFIESFTSNPSTPSIELTDYLIYTQAGSQKPDWTQYISAVKYHSNTNELAVPETYLEEMVIDDSNVDMSEPGSYYVTFEYIGDNNLTAITRLVVIVE